MGNPERQVVLALVTFPDETVAADIARTLLEERLVACVNLLPGVRSLYRWEGRVEDDAEVLGVLKTARDRVEALTRRVVELHPYDTPEVVAIDPAAVEGRYGAWALGQIDEEPGR
jgi:periplasmic divalent cation tolerance protein